jgi:hypothetical protein
MTKLYASHSSEFFAVREPGRLYIYRDSFLDITHRVMDQMAGDLIHLSDGGDCFFRSKEGLFRLRREKGVRAERCKAVAGLDGSPEGGVLRGFTVRADGELVAYEQVVPAQKFSSKLKRFLGQKSSQGDVGPSLHRIMISGWSGRSSSSYFETVVDPRTSAGLVWWSAPDFGFLAVLERERDGRSVLRVIDVLHESLVNELSVDGKLSRDRAVTANGTVGFGLEKQGRRAFVIWTYSRDRFQVAYPKDSRMLHLSKDRAVFLNRAEHFLTVKSFTNEVLAEVSLAALARLGVEYLVNFNPRGSIELVTYHNGKLRVHHTDIEQLPTDAKRWELVGERQRAERIEEETQAVLNRGSQQQDIEQFDEQRQQLGDEIDAYGRDNPFQRTAPPGPVPPPIPPPLARESLPAPLDLEVLHGGQSTPAPVQEAPTPQFASKAEAQEALERLRMGYIAGELSREDYYLQKSSIERAIATFTTSVQPGEGPPRTLSISNE